MTSKRALRQAAQRARTSPAPSLAEVLAPLLAEATAVASFVPLSTEPGVAPRAGWLLPVVLPDLDLDWAVFDGSLETARGLQEPTGPRLGVDAIGRCDLVLVPALLVARDGTRLGKGGGCYDRALLRATGLTVALINDDELVESLPHEDHDVPVQAVATPSRGLIRLPGRM